MDEDLKSVGGGWPTQRGFRSVGIDAAEVSGLVHVSLRGHGPGHAFPPVELAGYFLVFAWILWPHILGPGGTSENSPAFATPGRGAQNGTACRRHA